MLWWIMDHYVRNSPMHQIYVCLRLFEAFSSRPLMKNDDLLHSIESKEDSKKSINRASLINCHQSIVKVVFYLLSILSHKYYRFQHNLNRKMKCIWIKSKFSCFNVLRFWFQPATTFDAWFDPQIRFSFCFSSLIEC